MHQSVDFADNWLLLLFGYQVYTQIYIIGPGLFIHVKLSMRVGFVKCSIKSIFLVASIICMTI